MNIQKLFALLVITTLVMTASASPCSLDEAVTFKSEVDKANAEVATVQNQIERDNYVTSVMRETLEALSPDCQAEILRRVERNVQCERLNRDAYNREAQAIGLAQAQYILNGNIDEYWDRVIEINRAILLSTPSECWFQGVAQEQGKIQEPTCTQQWQQYNECKRKVDEALKRCAVMPGPCRDLGPTCFVPTCTPY